MGSRIFCVRILAKCTRVQFAFWRVVGCWFIAVLNYPSSRLTSQGLQLRALRTAVVRRVFGEFGKKYMYLEARTFVSHGRNGGEGACPRVSRRCLARNSVAQVLVKEYKIVAPKQSKSITRCNSFRGFFVFVVRATHLEALKALTFI
ncbi:Hypothetical_protein [Hexamita inflata]|uniref:Hypothetical_protein n=1 Tax=Hexamita inflata TaxID=28002 RepID=A0ABP1GLZ8_9EUKA